jgi:hypothetical protein
MSRSINARFDKLLSRVLLLALGLIAPIACAAQVASTTIVRTGAREVLARFEKHAQAGNAAVPDVVRHPENYPRTTVDSVIDGLENLAMRAEPEFARRDAIIALTLAGSDKHPIPGIFERVMRVYQRSDSHLVRVMVIGYIADGQDRARAIEFLKSTATTPPPPRFDVAPILAAQQLSHMAGEGRAILSELYAKGAIQDPRAYGFVRWFLTTQ